MAGMNHIREILEAAEGGEHSAERLLPLVYEELRRLAAQKLAKEPAGLTLQPTALVHEAWLRLLGDTAADFQARGHFFAAAAEAMRRILIERARQRKSLKRGAGAQRVDLDDLELAAQADSDTLLMIDEALGKLALADAEAARMIELRFFAGLNTEEIASALGLSERTVRNRWAFARAWLYRELKQQGA